MSTEAKEFLEMFKGDLAKMKEQVPDTVQGFAGMFSKVMKDGTKARNQSPERKDSDDGVVNCIDRLRRTCNDPIIVYPALIRREFTLS